MVTILGDVAAGSTLYVPFATYNSSGASVPITGLAVTDIEIYKDGNVTQRASDAGYALLDTDGIDFDGITGIHGFSVDLSDNTIAGFYAAGSTYWLVVSAITVDSQTVNLVYYFTIDKANVLRPTITGRTLDVAATGEAGVDLDNILLTNGAPKAGIHASGTLNGTHSATTADLGANAPGSGQIVVGMTLYFPAHGLSVLVTDYDDTTGIATFDAITPALANGNVWFLFPTAAGTGGSGLDADGVRAAVGLENPNLDTQLAAILALLDDPRTEPGQGTPPVNPDAMTKLDYVYKFLRNKLTQTATQFSVYADDGTTVDHKATVSSDGTTLTRGEIVTGP